MIFCLSGDADRQKGLCSKDLNFGERPWGLRENRYLPILPKDFSSPCALSLERVPSWAGRVGGEKSLSHVNSLAL
jgi:hypothetical protein